MDRVLIIGGGFGGLAVARGLASAPVEVTLVDRRNFHTFQPLLYQVATAGLNPADIAHPIRGVLRTQRNATVVHGTVTGVDWEERTAAILGDDGATAERPFDHLVLAAGSSPHFFGVPGAPEWSFPLYSLDDATALRNHVLSRFEVAASRPELVDDGILTFLVVGGGPTGVETAGALAELFHSVLRRDFPGLDVSRARVVLVEMVDSVLPPFSPASRWHAHDALRERGVELIFSDTVAEVAERRVVLGSGREIPAHTVVWAAGVRANPLASALGIEVGGGGRIMVDDHLRVPSRPGVYAIGDIAAVPGSDGAPLPQLAPVAIRSGDHVAREISARAAGSPPPERFRYRDRGKMATIGRRSAVAELPLGLRLSGSPAWLAWLLLHLVWLIGFRNRLSVLLNWAWSYVARDRGERLIFGPRRPGQAPPTG